jgi:parallel beta-helix repeat protein
MHSGGNSLINSETYESAGTGLSPDGSNNVITGNYIHDNSSHGIYMAGGNNLTLCNNIFYDNGGIEIYHLNYGDQSRICNNTIVVGPKYFTSATSGYSWGIYLHTTAQGATYENNIVEGFQYGIFNSATLGSTITMRNNLIRTAPAGNEFYLTDGAAAPVRTNNLLNLDPKFVDQAYAVQEGVDPDLGGRHPGPIEVPADRSVSYGLQLTPPNGLLESPEPTFAFAMKMRPARSATRTSSRPTLPRWWRGSALRGRRRR